MAKIRVLHCCNILDLGGEKSILVHSKYADKTRFEVFACGRLYSGRRVPEFEKLGISVYVAPLSAIGRFHPRVVETFGCVIAEAMANRLPVVMISTPQRKKSNAQVELVEDGVTGVVCRFQWSYAAAAVELLRNHPLREKMGQRGYDKAREQFEAGKITRRLEQIYLDLMDQPS